MKTLKSLFILSILTLGSNSYSKGSAELNLSNIMAIRLNSGKLIHVNQDVESIQVAGDRANKVDYVELRQGTIIDSYDIDRVILEKPRGTVNLTDYLGSISPDTFILLERVLGDGSGG
ncbi:hypothetical protein [Halobacteriovorax sp. JY17]|uniref:hypothetical protein n=1 Tax=Halobacteriovorax sp. JY17 TaxID=2014617 RepID=UPI000C427F5E|nr:hypothetical protein [Halobacteriovorax sp. JY17]PIK13510.1 MAG: hypothetical protein CES88_16455 [Halobacteriovorax sp. JY17]